MSQLLQPLARAQPRPIAPAIVLPPPAPAPTKLTFRDIPPEIRVEIFKLVIADVHTYITPVPQAIQQDQATQQQQGQGKKRKREVADSSQPPQPPPRPPQHSTNQPTAQQHPQHHPAPTVSTIHALLSPPPPSDLSNYYLSTSTSHATTPPTTTTTYHHKPRTYPRPHPLALTSTWIRNESLPLLHERCAIHARIVDFDFTPLLTFLSRIPPDDQRKLLKNPSLEVELVTTARDGLGGLESLRRWLHLRADECRSQADWVYVGERPGKRIVNDLRRRVRRMKEVGKRAEFERMLRGLGIDINGRAGDD